MKKLSYLKANKAIFKKFTYNKMIKFTSECLASNKVIGWFQGKWNLPRALGNRSILANPLFEKTQKQLNLKIKYRESFRPFAPSILKEEVSNWFEFKGESPYMLLVASIKNKLKIKMNKRRKKSFRN